MGAHALYADRLNRVLPNEIPAELIMDRTVKEAGIQFWEVSSLRYMLNVVYSRASYSLRNSLYYDKGSSQYHRGFA